MFYIFRDRQATQTFSSSSEFKTKIIIEQRPEVVQPNISPHKQKLDKSVPVIPPVNPPVAHSTSYEKVDPMVTTNNV